MTRFTPDPAEQVEGWTRWRRWVIALGIACAVILALLVLMR